MLSEAKAHAALPAQDLERAKSWYAEKLGLKPAEESPGGLFYDVGQGTRFLVFPSGGRPSGDHTQVGFIVADVVSEVEDLRADGVVFEEYDLPGLKTFNGVAEVGPTKAAWFKDSEGNVLGIIQFA
jgi:catechol 2,3-dioxygenase-like lactoylglutathione lyase family enzyme